MANNNTVQLQMDKEKVTGGIRVRRVVANVVLVFLCVLCLIWFYMLFVNATLNHGQLTSGILRMYPGTNFGENFRLLMGGKQIALTEITPEMRAELSESDIAKIEAKNADLQKQIDEANKTPFIKLIAHSKVWKGLLNSLIIAVGSAVLCTYFSTMTAYAIHCYNFKAKKFIFTFILMIMTIPTQVTAVGFVRLMRTIHLHDTFLPLIVPAIAAPVTFFYMKQYMDSTLPIQIVEAARIDGSGEFRTFNTIVLPMMKPAIAVQAIFTFVGSWNNYFVPSLILDSAKNKTLPILIWEQRNTDWKNFNMGTVYMMILLSIFPVIVVYFLLSKYIVGGVALGSVKG